MRVHTHAPFHHNLFCGFDVGALKYTETDVQRRIEKAEVIVDPTVFAYEGAPEDFETLELGDTDYIDHPPGCAIGSALGRCSAADGCPWATRSRLTRARTDCGLLSSARLRYSGCAAAL